MAPKESKQLKANRNKAESHSSRSEVHIKFKLFENCPKCFNPVTRLDTLREAQQ